MLSINEDDGVQSKGKGREGRLIGKVTVESNTIVKYKIGKT